MRRNQLTIAYPEGEAQQLHLALLLLKRVIVECISILRNGDCGEAGATGGSDMKAITIQLPDIGAAMFYETKK